MAARMADTRQSIIFSIEVDKTTTRAAQGFKRGIKSIGVTGDIESLFFEKITNVIVGVVFLIGCFWVGPDLDGVSLSINHHQTEIIDRPFCLARAQRNWRNPMRNPRKFSPR